MLIGGSLRKPGLSSQLRKTTIIFSGALIMTVAAGALASFSPTVGTVILAVFFGLSGLMLLATRLHWVPFILAVFVPFESFILAHLPVSDRFYFYLQFANEFLVYLAFVMLLVQKMLRGASFRRTPIDSAIGIFILVASLSTLVNQAPWFGSLMNLRALYRYIVLFYLVVNLNLDMKQTARITRVILFIGLLQVLIAGFQLVSGGVFNDFLLPRQIDVEVAGYSRQFVLISRGRELGSVFGTLGDTLFFGLFMLIIFAILLGHFETIASWNTFFLALVFCAILFSYARAIVFGALLLLLFVYRIRRGIKKMVPMFLMTFPLAMIALLLILSSFGRVGYIAPRFEQQNIIKNVTGILSKRYFEIAQKQRLGALVGVAPTVLVNKPIFGYGPDEETTIERLNASQPSLLLNPVKQTGFEDVYWVAILAYYGMLGAGALALILYKLFNSAGNIFKRAVKDQTRHLALSVMCVVGLTPFLLFFYRVLEFRIFSSYFWLLSALMYSLHIQELKLLDLQNSRPTK
jgi:hypothetical protein